MQWYTQGQLRDIRLLDLIVKSPRLLFSGFSDRYLKTMYTTIKRKHKNQEMIGIEEGIIIKVSIFNSMRQLQGQYFRFFYILTSDN